MKKAKVLTLTLCAVLLVTASVIGTLAYLTSQDTVINTFTVGKVNIILDETDVTPDGKPIDGAARVKENSYHLVPGNTYKKDPRMTVLKGSEESYVRMLVTVNCMKELDNAFAPETADLTTIFNGYDASNWVYKKVIRDANTNTVTYEFRYKEKVSPNANENTVLDALFDSITVPSYFNSDDMSSLKDLKITVIGHAIQATGFDDADAAWTAFDNQING